MTTSIEEIDTQPTANLYCGIMVVWELETDGLSQVVACGRYAINTQIAMDNILGLNMVDWLEYKQYMFKISVDIEFALLDLD